MHGSTVSSRLAARSRVPESLFKTVRSRSATARWSALQPLGVVEKTLKIVDEAGGVEPVGGGVVHLDRERLDHSPRSFDVTTEGEDGRQMSPGVLDLKRERGECRPRKAARLAC